MRADRLYVVTVIIAALVLSSVPYALGYAAQTDDLRFSGALFDLPDYHSHLAKMQLGARGEWQYRLLFTPEDHAGAYLQTFYVALGQLARLTGLALPLVYQFARLAGGALVLLAVWRFFCALTPSRPVRRLALWLVAFSSGLGWLMQLLAPVRPGGISAIDFWLVDAYTFFSILTFPHFTFAVAFLLEGFVRWLRVISFFTDPAARQWSAWRDVIFIAVLDFGLGVIHPYALLLALLIPALHAALLMWRHRCIAWRTIGALVAIGVVVSPVLVYDLWVFRTNPVFAAWSAQNVTSSPPPQYYLLGYGLVAALAVWGAGLALRHGGEQISFAMMWIVVAFVLAYLPWSLQRRFVEGVQVPICLLAAYALVYRRAWSGRLHATPIRRWRRFWAIHLTLGATVITNLYMVAGFSVGVLVHHPALFDPSVKVVAINWLGAHSSPLETVLASEPVGSAIPALTGHRVVLGHEAETADYRGKRVAVAAFFNSASTDAERLAMLKRWGVHYIYHGPDERALGAFDPSRTSYLVQVFRAGDVAVYQVELT